MDVTHAACELFSQIMARKMNIDQGGGRIPVASELRNLMQIPPRACQICQAKMAKSMG